MNETALNVKNLDIWPYLSTIFMKVDKNVVYDILDAGSGKTSLSCLITYFRDARIDAVCYPGDTRKTDSITSYVKSNRYSLIEMDLVKEVPTKKYDVVLAHLLLGEAKRFGNSVENLIHSLFKVNSKYFIICDYLEDPSVNFNYLENYVMENNFKVLLVEDYARSSMFSFTNFEANTYRIYLIEKSK